MTKPIKQRGQTKMDIDGNLLTIVLFVLGVSVAFLIYWQQKKEAGSIKDERRRTVIRGLIEIIENDVINKQKVSELVISNLIVASERSHLVVLYPACNPMSLLQDVLLRIQSSKHLDSEEKSGYIKNISELIQTLSNKTYGLSNFDQFFQSLIALVPTENKNEAQKISADIDAELSRLFNRIKLFESIELVRKDGQQNISFFTVIITSVLVLLLVMTDSFTLLNNMFYDTKYLLGKPHIRIHPFVSTYLIFSLGYFLSKLMIYFLNKRKENRTKGSW